MCEKALDYHGRFYCVVCARTALYSQRLEEASLLMEKETLGKHVETVLKGSDGSSVLKSSQDSVTVALHGSTGGVLIDYNECVKRTDLDRLQTEVDETSFRIQDVRERSQALRLEMAAMKRRNVATQSMIMQKRNDISSATYGLVERRNNETDKVKRAISRAEFKSGRTHDEMVSARASLCLEAASLRRLRRASKSKTRDGRELFYLGFHRIYDLRDLNSKSHPVSHQS